MIHSPTPLWRRAWRLARLAAHLIHGLATLAWMMPRAPRARRERVIRAWDGKLLSIFGVHLTVDAPPGFERDRPRRLYIGNHISWIDIFALQAVTAARFVAKSELARDPLVGRLIRKSGTLFIERARRADTRRINSTLCEHLREGDIIAVFPEGSTSDGRGVNKFHANLLQAALDADADIVPFCLIYTDARGHYSDAAAFVGEMTLWQSLKRILRERSLHCELTLYEPLKTAGRDRRQLADAAQALVRQRLQGHTRQDR